MGYIPRHWLATSTVTEAMAVAALEQVLPAAVLQGAAADAAVPTERRRKLPAEVTVLLCVAMRLFTQSALRVVLHKLVHSRRLFGPEPESALASKSAISQARYRLGARPLVALLHQIGQPVASAQTPRAFRLGRRLVAIDGTVDEVPDSPANVGAFGRHHSDRGARAFPQVPGVDLSECGTHAVIEAGFWPGHTSERVGARRLLRSVGAGMRVLLDRGFCSFEMIERPRARGGRN